MRKVVLAVFCGCIMAVLAIGGHAFGQNSPPPPPPPGATFQPIQPPCPPTGCPTATPTITPTPTNTPTATPTNTPIPLFATMKLAHKSVKVGAKQKVSVTTLPGAHVTIRITYPNKSKHIHTGNANVNGGLSWSYKQPSGRTTSKSRTASVTVTVTDGTASSVKASKKYTIS